MANLIEIRRDTAANWTSVNPVLASGEMGYETDTRNLKIGDGSTTWASLAYAFIKPAQLTNSGIRVKPLDALPPAMSTPPTLAWSGPGGTSPVTGTEYFLDSRGGSPVADVNVLNTNSSTWYWDSTYNRVDGNANGGWTSSEMAIEFDFYGSDLSFNFVPEQASLVAANTMKLWIDGQPVTLSEPGAATTVNSAYFLRVTFGAAGLHRIKLGSLAWGIRSITTTNTSTITHTAAPSVNLMILGDSWVEGANGSGNVDILAARVARYLGLNEPIIAGQGGTGYANPAGSPKSVFNSAARIANITGLKPTDLIVFGSINDNSYAAATIQANATNLYSQIQTALPNTRVYVVLPQTTNSASDALSTYTANKNAVKAAAQAAPNVRAIIDTVGWLTGSGYAGSRSVTDGATTASSTTITSATASFVSGDVGHIITGGSIPANTTIASVTNSTTAVLSAAPTATASGVSLTITNQSGSGNRDLFLSNDNIHPTLAGHDYFAKRLATALAPYMNALA